MELFFCVTGPLCGEFTDHQWIPLTEASDADFRCFPWSAPWITGWVNNREAGDLRRYRAPYDVIVMTCVWRVHSRTSAKTHWTLNIMAKFLPTFSNAFPSLKPFQWSSIITHSNMFLKFQLAIIHHWFKQKPGDKRTTSQYLNRLFRTSHYLHQWFRQVCLENRMLLRAE